MRLAVFAYAPEGLAWVRVVVVTIPVDFPAFWAHSAMEVRRFAGSWLAVQLLYSTAALTPILTMLVFTPHKYAVAVQAESGTWALEQ